jgi:hypothetical protein
MDNQYSQLSKAEEEFLASYTGKRYTLTDGNGTILEQSDTRTAEGVFLRSKKKLKQKIAIRYGEEYPQYKIDQARMGTLTDETEKAEILAFDEEQALEYSLRKAEMEVLRASEDPADMDKIERFAISDDYEVVNETLQLKG